MSFPRTLGELRHSPFSEEKLRTRRVKDELRDNLMVKLRQGGPIFPGIVGYDDTVVPQIVNAVLSRHNFILLVLLFACVRTAVASRKNTKGITREPERFFVWSRFIAWFLQF